MRHTCAGPHNRRDCVFGSFIYRLLLPTFSTIDADNLEQDKKVGIHLPKAGTQTTRREESPRAAITGLGRPRPKRLRYNWPCRTGKAGRPWNCELGLGDPTRSTA